MSKPNFIRNWLILLSLLAVVFFGGKFYWNYQLSAPNIDDKIQKVFVISKGESLGNISSRLEENGFIRSRFIFNMMAQKSGMAGKIQTGDFKLSPSMNAEEILKELTVGVIDKWVTLLEGWRIEEVAEKLNKELGINKTEFIKAAKEGYMFPDTYLFNPQVKVADIVWMLKNNFNQKYTPELQNKIKKLNLTPEQGVILASIVEREARSDEARQMVASILLKRLKIGMGLNVDASIQYLLGYQDAENNPPSGGWWKRHLTKEDLKVDSLFNTYLYKGLPPAPICNPSLSSLKAVADANPATPYLYYYHDSKGISHYGRTLDEHNENIARYP